MTSLTTTYCPLSLRRTPTGIWQFPSERCLFQAAFGGNYAQRMISSSSFTAFV